MHNRLHRALALSLALTPLLASPASAAPPREHHGIFQVLVSDQHQAERPRPSGARTRAEAFAARDTDAQSELIYEVRDTRGKRRRILGLEGVDPATLPASGTAVSLYASEQPGDVLMAYGGPAGGPAPTPTQSAFPPAVLGSHDVLVTVVTFADTANSETIATQQGIWFGPNTDNVSALISEASYGKFGITGDVRAVTLTTAMGTGCDYYTWADAADVKLRAAGTEPNNYDHVAYILPSTAACPWQGLAQLGGRIMWGTYATAPVMVHELGHNLGFAHSTEPALVGLYEYGDSTSFMGRSDALTLDVAHRYQGGWLDQAAVGTFEEDGTYELASLDLPFSGVQQALVFPDATTPSRLWFVSARTPVGRAGRALWEEDRSGPSLHSLGPTFGELSLLQGTVDDIGEVLQAPNEGVRIVHRYVSLDRVWVDVLKSCATFKLSGNNEIYATGLGARRFTFLVKNRSCPAGTAFRFDPGTPAAGWSVVASPTTFTSAVGVETAITVDVTPSASVTFPAYVESAWSTASASLETGEPGVRFTLDYTAHLYNSPPSAPYRVAIWSSTSTSKSLEWYPAPSIANVVSYEVWRSLSGGAFTKIATLAAQTVTTRNTYSDNHGVQANPPAYAIIAVDAGGLRGVRSKVVGTLPAGSAPVVVNETVSVPVGQWLEVMVLANDSDPDGQAITLSGVGGQVNTSAYENGFQRVRYVPRTDRIWIKGTSAGPTALPYEVTDQFGRATTGTINVTVTPIPTVTPLITADSVTVGQGEVAVVDVLANDPVNTQYLPITVCGLGAVTYGSTWLEGGLLHYRSFPGRAGPDTAYVKVCNALGNYVYEPVAVTVLEGGSAPIANAGLDRVASDDDGDGFGEVEVGGVAVDPDGGTTTATWFANGVVIGTQALLVADLPLGTTTLTLVVQDEEGGSASDQVNVTVLANRAPVVAAAGPDQTAEEEGDGKATLLFETLGSYDLEGALTATWSWTAGGLPQSVTGSPVTARLPLGTTVVTLTVRDAGGLTATDTLTVTVVPGTPDTVNVADLDGIRSSVNATKWNATVTIEVRNDLNQLVSNTTVKATWSKGSGTTTCTTNSTGRCSMKSGDVAKSTVASLVFTVTKLTKTGLPYAPVDNFDPDDDSTGTVITVNKP